MSRRSRSRDRSIPHPYNNPQTVHIEHEIRQITRKWNKINHPEDRIEQMDGIISRLETKSVSPPYSHAKHSAYRLLLKWCDDLKLNPDSDIIGKITVQDLWSNYSSKGGGGQRASQKKQSRRKTIRRGGHIISLAYYPGFGTGMRSDIHIQTEKPVRGWLASLKDLETDITEFFQGMLATDDQREERKKKTSVFLLKEQKQPEVADVKEKRETPICLSDKKDESNKKEPEKKV